MELEQMVGSTGYKELLNYCKTVNSNIDKRYFAAARSVLTEFFGENFDMPEEMTPEIYHRCMIENHGENYLAAAHMSKMVLDSHIPGIPVTLYYDEIDVTNDHREKHKIREIYIRFYLAPAGFLVGHFYGLRTAATPKEFNEGFLHSHPGPTRVITQFTPFCTGEGPINGPIGKLSSSTGRFDANVFKGFLVGIKAYLGWEESLGGYHNIHRFSDQKASFDSRYLVPYFPTVLTLLKRHEFRDLLKVQMSGNSIKVLPTTEFEQLLGKICKAGNMHIFLAQRNTKGEYLPYRLDHRETAKNTPKHTIIRFRGEDKKFRIIGESHDFEDQLLVDPALTRMVCKAIASKMTKYAALSSTNKKHQTVNYGESDKNVVGATAEPLGIS